MKGEWYKMENINYVVYENPKLNLKIEDTHFEDITILVNNYPNGDSFDTCMKCVDNITNINYELHYN